MLGICHCKLEMYILKITFYIFAVMQKGQWEIGSSLLCVVFVAVFYMQRFLFSSVIMGEGSRRYPWGCFREFIFN